MKINDTQNNAIFNAIYTEHNTLDQMYKNIKLVEKRQKIELEKLKIEIKNQEQKVTELSEGKIKIVTTVRAGKPPTSVVG